MTKINNPKIVRLLALLCSLTYVASYLTRLNFAVVTVEIIKETGWDKSAISAVTTALFISYGVGQLISGWLGDHTPPHRLMAIGLVSSAAMNLLIPFCTTIGQMTIIWAVNGLAQAMLWPPIVRILSSYCYRKDYQDSTVIVSWGGSIGTIIVFLLASLLCATIGWRPLFYICAAFAVSAAAVWLIGFSRISAYATGSENLALASRDDTAPRAGNTSPTQNSAADDKKSKLPAALLGLLCILFLAIIVLGALRDSIQSWLPNYIYETFNLDSSTAILTSVILPIFTTITYPIVLAYYRRFFKSEITCAATIYALSAFSAFLLCFISDFNPIISVLLLATISACMHGANFLIIGLIPKRFDKYGNVSTISGVLNSFVYVGSSLSIWGIAVIAERLGWIATIISWGILSVIGMAICLSVSKGFKKYF